MPSSRNTPVTSALPESKADYTEQDIRELAEFCFASLPSSNHGEEEKVKFERKVGMFRSFHLSLVAERRLRKNGYATCTDGVDLQYFIDDVTNWTKDEPPIGSKLEEDEKVELGIGLDRPPQKKSLSPLEASVITFGAFALVSTAVLIPCAVIHTAFDTISAAFPNVGFTGFALIFVAATLVSTVFAGIGQGARIKLAQRAMYQKVNSENELTTNEEPLFVNS